MPRSVFLGRVVADGEPAWLPDDRAWALALAEVEADDCPSCGHPRSVTTLPSSEFAYRAEAVRCHACAAIEREGRDFAKDGDTAGLLMRAVRG